jgi:hypothetical protein
MLRDVVNHLVTRDWPSPETFVTKKAGIGARPSGSSVRRIMNGQLPAAEVSTFWLTKISTWLGLPGDTLAMVRAGDVAGLRRLEFKDDAADARRFILDRMSPPPSPPVMGRVRKSA